MPSNVEHDTDELRADAGLSSLHSFHWLHVGHIRAAWKIFFVFKIFLIYLFRRDPEREAETQAEGEAGSMQGARWGTRSRDPGVTPWAKGRCQTAESPGDPQLGCFCRDECLPR